MENKKVLLIDDEDQFRSGAKIALKKMGYEVVEAADGFDGMKQIVRNNLVGNMFNLIILDIMMPKISGVDVLEFLVQKKIDVPVLIITGFMDYDLRCFCSKIKSLSVLEKPFQSVDLMEKVNSLAN
jgi:DNA-binding response OmpR family regulator